MAIDNSFQYHKDQDDTIVAIATAPGYAGVGIIRLSGPQARSIAQQIIPQANLTHGRVHFSKYVDLENQLIDQGITLYCQAPRSFTGQDVVELQCHGSPVVLNDLLLLLCRLGARMAMPGEFCLRAFLNDKIDLVQAESIERLIKAQTAHEARSAMRTLDGKVSKDLQIMSDELKAIRVDLQAGIDFAHEDDVSRHHTVDSWHQRITQLHSKLDRQLAISKQASTAEKRYGIALIGPVNSGKSTLFNRFSSSQQAIVTDIPGTTRDPIACHIDLGQTPVTLFDTAGLRDTVDVVEKIGITKTKDIAELADLIVCVFDASIYHVEQANQWIQNHIGNIDKPLILLLNKADICSHSVDDTDHILSISALNDMAIDDVKDRLIQSIKPSNESVGLVSNLRQCQALEQAIDQLELALQTQDEGLLSTLLESSHDALGRMVGRVDAQHLLGDIFSKFCIGK